MELIRLEENKVVIAEDVLRDLKMYNELKKKYDPIEKNVKDSLLKVMEDNGIDKFENDFMSVSYIAPTDRVSVDTKALKEDGLYDMYTKTSPVKASIRVKYK